MTDQTLPARVAASLAAALSSCSATIEPANETTKKAGKDQKMKKAGAEVAGGAKGNSHGLVLKGGNDFAAAAGITGAAAAKIDNLGGASLAQSATCVSRQPLSSAYPGAMAAAFVIAYAPTYVSLAEGPWQTEQEGHGPIIMLGAAWLAWQQRRKLASATFKLAPVAGWIILIVSLLIMAVTRSQNIVMIEVATQVPVLLGCLLLIGGWPLARIFAFPLAFLIFSVPPPGWLLDAATIPLKGWISDVVTNLLYALDYPIAQNGVMIMIGSYELMVKDACSGINSIFALSAIGIFYVHEFVHNNWIRRVILIASIIPITILANIVRVIVLVLGAYYFGPDRIEGLFHDLTGISLFVFALALFFLLDGVIVGVGFIVLKGWSSWSVAGKAA